MSKTTKIADEVKFYRLVPLALAIAYIWSISTIMIGEPPTGGVARFIGYYIGAGVPRFAVYIFCIGFVLYNYNKITDGDENNNLVPIAVVLLIVGSAILWSNIKEEDIHLGCYPFFLLAEYLFYKNFLTSKPDTTPSEE
jgi:hypothetical protein